MNAVEINICGYSIIIDSDDYEKIISRKWYKNTSKEKAGFFYVDTAMKNKYGKWSNISMHRFIMNCNVGKNICVDHINGNTLDNRKNNLRICSRTENSRNTKLSKNNSTGYKGVTYYKRDGKYVAKITVDRKRIHIGYFTTLIEAATAYDLMARKHFGEYANINIKTATTS